MRILKSISYTRLYIIMYQNKYTFKVKKILISYLGSRNKFKV